MVFTLLPLNGHLLWVTGLVLLDILSGTYILIYTSLPFPFLRLFDNIPKTRTQNTLKCTLHMHAHTTLTFTLTLDQYRYAHYDGTPSFGDFQPFAGWSKPAVKQYVGDAAECGAGIDKNWYP